MIQLYRMSPKAKVNAIAYIRYTDDPWDAGRQLGAIQAYCGEHNLRLVKAFEDVGSPSWGLDRALEALHESGALIAVDLDRFFENVGDRIRELKPLIQDLFELKDKRLIMIKEGVDTGSAIGQLRAIALINERSHNR